MSLVSRALSIEQIFALADAFGLAGDCIGLSEAEWDDCLAAPIIPSPSYQCFVTKRTDDPLYYDSTTSVVACTDGRLVACEPFEWTSIGEGGVDHRGEFKWWAYWYRAFDASYAATEIRGVPERLFIFNRSPKLDFSRMYHELRAHRLARLPIIFPGNERK